MPIATEEKINSTCCTYSKDFRRGIRESIRMNAKESKCSAKELALLTALQELDNLREAKDVISPFFDTIDNLPYDDGLPKKVKSKTYKTVLEGVKLMKKLLDDLYTSTQTAVVLLEEGYKA